MIGDWGLVIANSTPRWGPALFIFLVPAFWLFYRFLSRASTLSVEIVAIGTACLAFFAISVVESSFYFLQPALLFWMFFGCLAATLLEK